MCFEFRYPIALKLFVYMLIATLLRNCCPEHNHPSGIGQISDQSFSTCFIKMLRDFKANPQVELTTYLPLLGEIHCPETRGGDLQVAPWHPLTIIPNNFRTPESAKFCKPIAESTSHIHNAVRREFLNN